MVSGKLPPRKITPRSGSSFWFRISVRIRAGGQFSLGTIFLEHYNTNVRLFTYLNNKLFSHEFKILNYDGLWENKKKAR